MADFEGEGRLPTGVVNVDGSVGVAIEGAEGRLLSVEGEQQVWRCGVALKGNNTTIYGKITPMSDQITYMTQDIQPNLNFFSWQIKLNLLNSSGISHLYLGTYLVH